MVTQAQRGQSTVEYAVLFAVIIAALIGIQVYMKRGTMGKLRESTDQIGAQFDPYSETYKIRRTTVGSQDEKTDAIGEVIQRNVDVVQTKSGEDHPVGVAMDKTGTSGMIFDPTP